MIRTISYLHFRIGAGKLVHALKFGTIAIWALFSVVFQHNLMFEIELIFLAMVPIIVVISVIFEMRKVEFDISRRPFSQSFGSFWFGVFLIFRVDDLPLLPAPIIFFASYVGWYAVGAVSFNVTTIVRREEK